MREVKKNIWNIFDCLSNGWVFGLQIDAVSAAISEAAECWPLVADSLGAKVLISWV